MIHYGCPNCGEAMASPESAIGQKEKCPQCGNATFVPAPQAQQAPMGGSGYAPQHSGQVVTTEKTSKRLKLYTLIAWLTFIAGAVLVAIAMTDVGEQRGSNSSTGGMIVGGVLLSLFGLVLGLSTRLLIWWRHG